MDQKKCTYVRFPNHSHQRWRNSCSSKLLKRVKHGSTYRFVPRMIYAYNSLICSLNTLFNQPGYSQKCEQWRRRASIPGTIFTDVNDGAVWQKFQVVHGRPFLQVPNNLSLKLNVDWFSPFKHIQYSIGVIYLVIENLPQSDRYKLENILIVGCIPGPREPKLSINSFLEPLIDELIVLWKGKILHPNSLCGFVPIRCALSCATCDLPATCKVCGFTSFSSLMGCSKCKKQFECKKFGEKSDYSGFNRDH